MLLIYRYFEQLEAEARRLNVADRPECFWNLDETSMCTDPSKTKVIAPKGEKAARITATSGRENITVLAAVSASGDKTSPFIIFKAKYALKHWHTPNAYKGTVISKSDNGWITTEIFKNWFYKFCEMVTQRPLILVYDGHVTHVSYEVVKKAREENISIIKLPPHTTDRLQPLDVSCFKPLQTRWDQAVHKFQAENSAKKLSNSDFTYLLG